MDATKSNTCLASIVCAESGNCTNCSEIVDVASWTDVKSYYNVIATTRAASKLRAPRIAEIWCPWGAWINKYYRTARQCAKIGRVSHRKFAADT